MIDWNGNGQTFDGYDIAINVATTGNPLGVIGLNDDGGGGGGGGGGDNEGWKALVACVVMVVVTLLLCSLIGCSQGPATTMAIGKTQSVSTATMQVDGYQDDPCWIVTSWEDGSNWKARVKNGRIVLCGDLVCDNANGDRCRREPDTVLYATSPILSIWAPDYPTTKEWKTNSEQRAGDYYKADGSNIIPIGPSKDIAKARREFEKGVGCAKTMHPDSECRALRDSVLGHEAAGNAKLIWFDVYVPTSVPSEYYTACIQKIGENKCPAYKEKGE